MSLFSFLGLPWNLLLSVVAMIVACALVFDANWMVALIRTGLQSAPPPLFKSPIRIEGRWRRIGYLAMGVFGIAPILMQPVMGIGHMLPPLLQDAILVALAITILLIFCAAARGWRTVAIIAPVAATGLMLAPYALAGPVGWTRYAVVVGMLSFILVMLLIATLVRTWLLGYRPRSRAGAVVRLVADGLLAVATMVGTFWPLFG